MADEANRFGARLRELRAGAGLSQPILAQMVGLTVRQISRLETSAQVPTWPTILALAKALVVSCEAFTVEAAETPAPQRGRPRKIEAEADRRSTAKRAKRKK